VVAAARGKLGDIRELPVDEEGLAASWAEDEWGLWKRGDGLRRTGQDASRQRRPNGWFPVFITADNEVYVTEDDRPLSVDDEVLWPIDSDGNECSWSWSKAKINREPMNLLVLGRRGSQSIYKKQRPGIGDLPTRKAKSFLYAPKYSSTNGGNSFEALFGMRMSEFTPKSVELLEDLVVLGSGPGSWVLDYFAGSGTTGHALMNLHREGAGGRKSILVEMGEHFETVLLPRLKKVTFSPEWKDGLPRRLATPEEAERSPRVFKIVRLESYEDTLNNLELKRTEEQQSLLDTPGAGGADGLKEQYVLRYMLDVESRGSASLLNVSRFTDPRSYTLRVKRPGSDETREVAVDLLETFNWLLGLRVHHIAATRSFSAAFKRDDEGRLRIDGRLRPNAGGTWWFRTVEGEAPDGRKVLVIWRNRPGGDDAEGIEQDNLVLDEWFTRQGYSAKDSEFDLIYVNGDNNLENLKDIDDRWKVRLIEEEFFRLMFDVEDV
jgi:adenine-specific DNA-methyltransferase